MIGTSIYAALNGQKGITDLVGSRIYPVMLPQADDLPALVYSIGSAMPSHTNDSASKLDKFQFQVYCIATSYAVVDDLATKVRDALHAYKTSTVQEIRYNTEMDDFEELTALYVRVLTFTIRFKIA